MHVEGHEQGTLVGDVNPPKSILDIQFEYIVKPASLCVISISVWACGANELLLCSSCLGLNTMSENPLALWGKVREFTQSVGLTCEVILSCAITYLSCASISSLPLWAIYAFHAVLGGC